MNCMICNHERTQPGTVTVTLERGPTTLVFKNVPAQVCANCGEAYVDEFHDRAFAEGRRDRCEGRCPGRDPRVCRSLNWTQASGVSGFRRVDAHFQPETFTQGCHITPQRFPLCCIA